MVAGIAHPQPSGVDARHNHRAAKYCRLMFEFFEVKASLTQVKDTVMARFKADKDFREELIIEATNALLEGGINTGKSLIKDDLNATEAFACCRCQPASQG